MVRSTFMGFETAKSAIYVNQKALDIVGHNLSNVNTVGYTRQNVDVAALALYSSANRVSYNPIPAMGQGVEALGVAQTRDELLDKRFREEYGNTSYHAQAAQILQDIQVSLGDGADITSEDGLFGAINSLYTDLNSFIQDPTMDAQANLVMSSFKNITQVLNQLDANLTNIAGEYAIDLEVDVDNINDIAARIAHLNDIISKDTTILMNSDNENYGPNELFDERNMLLDELASYGNINVVNHSNGMIDVEFGQHTLVSGTDSDSLALNINEDSTIDISWASNNETISTTNGSLISAIHFLNGKGANVETNGDELQRGIPYYKSVLNTFAFELVDVANSTIPFYDETTGEPMKDADGDIVYKTLLGATTDDILSAANIGLSEDWLNAGASYFIYNEDENVEDYALKLATKLTTAENDFVSYGETYSGSFSDFVVNMVGTLGSDIAFHSGRQDAYAQISNDFLDQRDSISGVSSDEETANMLKFQKSYEAAARVMTVMDEILDVIINRTGLVGL